MGTYTQTFNGSNQNPWSDANWNQSLASGLQLLTASIRAVTADTHSFVTQVGSYSKTQTSEITTNFINDSGDLNSPDSAGFTISPLLLFTDANNFVGVFFDYQGGTGNPVTIRLSPTIAGVPTSDAFSVNWSRDTYTVGDKFKLGVTWSGADATFSFYVNGTQLGASITKTAFGLSSGKPGWIHARAASTRQALVSAITLTGTVTSAVLSAATPSGTLGTPTSATPGFTTDTAGGAAVGIIDVPARTAGVTAAQLKAGLNNLNATPVKVLTSITPTSGANTFANQTGLTANTAYSQAMVQTIASVDSNVLIGSFTTAVGTTGFTINLDSAPSTPLASTACHIWTKDTLAGAAVDGGSGGLAFTTDTGGALVVSGLTIAAGSKFCQYQVGTDPLNVHIVPVTVA